MSIDNIAERLADAARTLGSEGVERTLENSVSLALQLVEGCDGAGVSLVQRHDKSLKTPAATSGWVARGDALQYELQEGPCIDAAWEQEVVHSPNLAKDSRWPAWGPSVVEDLGVCSMLCVQLFANDHIVGALNLYSKQVGAFADGVGHEEALALAAQVAVAVVAAEQIEQLKTAVGGRTVIGQAQGIMMERLGIDAEAAFAVLRRVSMDTNVKLSQVAAEFVRTRQLPPSPQVETTL